MRRRALWLVASEWRRTPLLLVGGWVVGAFAALVFVLLEWILGIRHPAPIGWAIAFVGLSQILFFIRFDRVVPSARQAAARLKFLSDIPRGHA